jgi:hypothetical protein
MPPPQEPPTIQRSGGEFSPVSGQETTATEVDGNLDSDKGVQVRTIHGSGISGAPPSLTYMGWYRLDLRRQRSSSKREMTCFVVASGSRRCKAIGTGWLSFRRGDTHHRHRHRHRHGLQALTRKATHLRPKRRLALLQMLNQPALTTILRWSANVQKRGVSSMRISLRAT